VLIAFKKLKYEPQPQKDTLGFRVDPTDWVSWECGVPSAGRYVVEVLQGCGKGNGGSVVDVGVGEQTVRFRVEETGHFQRFVPRQIGTVELPVGKTLVTIKPVEKKGGAVMDLRRVSLIGFRRRLGKSGFENRLRVFDGMTPRQGETKKAGGPL